MEDSYVAGLFDGEGTVGIYKVSGNGKSKTIGDWWTIKIAIGGAYRPMIEAVFNHMKMGSFTTQKRQSIQRTPTENYGEGERLCKQGWRWIVTSRKECRQVLERLLPYLIEKKEQVQLSLDFIDGKIEGTEAALRCKELKKVSFPATDWIEPPKRSTGMRGMNNPMSKVTDDQVREIRKRYAAGENKLALANEFGFTSNLAVWKIATGRSYKWVI